MTPGIVNQQQSSSFEGRQAKGGDVTEVERLPDDYEIKGRHRKYNWDLWTDGGKYRARRGVHFTCQTASFQMQLYTKADQLGLGVETSRPTLDVVEFHFYRKDALENVTKAS